MEGEGLQVINDEEEHRIRGHHRHILITLGFLPGNSPRADISRF